MDDRTLLSDGVERRLINSPTGDASFNEREMGGIAANTSIPLN